MTDYINLLPNETLTIIFSKLDLVEKFRLELVCRRWKKVSPIVLAKVTSIILYDEKFAQEHDDIFGLIFFVPLNYSPKYGQVNSLKCNVDHEFNHQLLNITTARWLVKILPSIKSLDIYLYDLKSETFEVLIRAWTKLKRLVVLTCKLINWNQTWPLIQQGSGQTLNHLACSGIGNHQSYITNQNFPLLNTIFVDESIDYEEKFDASKFSVFIAQLSGLTR